MNYQTALILLLFLITCISCTPEDQARVDHALRTSEGQLFCRIQTAGGGDAVVAVADGSVGVLLPGALPIALIATGASKQWVDDACARVQGVPTSPPADPATAPVVPIVPPGP